MTFRFLENSGARGDEGAPNRPVSAGTPFAFPLDMTSRVNRLAKPRARTMSTPPAAFRPVAVSEVDVEVDEVVDADAIAALETFPRYASIPDNFPTYDENLDTTILRPDVRDDSFDATVRKPSTRTNKRERSPVAARSNRLFDAPFAHQVATTPPATFASRPVAPLARARNVVPPAAPSSTGQSLSPMSFGADDSGGHQVARVGAPTVLVRRASLSNESTNNVPSWLYAGVAAAVLIAGSLFAIGGRTPAQAQASAAQPQVLAPLQAPVQQAQAQQVQQQVQVAPVALRPQAAVVDPVLAAALAAPVTAPAPEALPATKLSQAAVPTNVAPAGKPGPRFASSRGTHVVAPQQVPVAVSAPRPIAAPAPVAMKDSPVEGGHDVRTSQQTSAAASKVIGDSL